MANRNRNSNIWKDTFYRGLPPLYKCLWDYINDDCDNAGVWIPDFKVASICIGKRIKPELALQLLNPKIQVLQNGNWLLPNFISDRLCFTDLKPTDRFQKSILEILAKHNLKINKGVVSPLQGAIRNTETEVKTEAEEKAEAEAGQTSNFEPRPTINDEPTTNFTDYELWTQSIIDHNDPMFEQMLLGEKLKPNGSLEKLARSHLELLARYPAMRPQSQQLFRYSALKHVRENIEKIKTNFKPHESNQRPAIDFSPGKDFGKF